MSGSVVPGGSAWFPELVPTWFPLYIGEPRELREPEHAERELRDEAFMAGNYQHRILEMIANGELANDGGIHQIEVQHDEWCQLLNGGYECNCEPEIVEGQPRFDGEAK